MVVNQVSSQEFKIAMRKYAYSVSIVSNTSNEGINNAITISSFTSISVDPPSVLMCINKSSSIHKTLIIDSSFCINLLNEKQKEIAELCANPNKSDERFNNKKWTKSNPPKLLEALVHLTCRVDKIIDYETHSIVIGIVKESTTSKHNNALMYKNQRFL
jgi:flavin reductase (DIM6/NTAB) family NADH-FMN oxidoreductase RutF